MKKFTAIILVLVMVMSLIPTVFAENDTKLSEIKVVYEFRNIGASNHDTLGNDITKYTYDYSGGFWCGAFAHAGYPSNELYTATMNKSYGMVVRYIGSWGAVKINVPVSGYYNNIKMKMHSIDSSPTELDIYIADIDTELTDSLDLSTTTSLAQNVDMSSLYVQNSENTLGEIDIPISQYIEAGEHYIIFHNNGVKHSDNGKNSQARIYTVTISGGDGLSPVIKNVTVTESLTLGESGKITATASSELSNYSTDAENVTFTYASSDDDVAEVSSDGTISAIAEGSAEITVTATSDSSKATHSATRTVTVNVTAPKVETAPKTSMWIGDNLDGKNVTVMIDGEEKTSETLLSEERGLSVKAVANAPAGYVFRGWVRGSAERGVWVSSEPEYTFITTTHSMLTAVFEEAADGDVIEYYNENGAYIETRSASESAPTGSEIPSLVGYVFDDWYVSETTKLSEAVLGSLTRAVAKHTPVATNATITSDGTPISATVFDSKVENMGTDDITCWKRNGEIIAYGRDYTYYVWGNTEIESSKEALSAVKDPIVYLDPVVNSNGARMIEYDKGDFEIVEVGILFGEEGGTPVITSCIEKMNSQRNSNHGQFTATPSDASYTARGYMIYRDNAEYKVIYSK